MSLYVQSRCPDARALRPGAREGGRGGHGRPLNAIVFVIRTDAMLAFGLIAVVDGKLAALVVINRRPVSKLKNGTSSTGLLSREKVKQVSARTVRHRRTNFKAARSASV